MDECVRQEAIESIKETWWESKRPEEQEELIDQYFEYMEDCHPEMLGEVE